MTIKESTILTEVDDAFIQQAEDQVYRILLQQRRAFNQRWQDNTTMNKGKTVLRYFGLLLCLAGIVIMLLALVYQPTWSFSQAQVYGLLVFFVLVAWFFIQMPKFDAKAKKWTDNTSQKSCRKLAKRCVKQAKGMLPFQAQYEIKGDLISYYRKQPTSDEGHEQWHFVWNRKMCRYAVQSALVTVFFKQAKSIQPKIIVLHDKPDELKASIRLYDISLLSMTSE
ncbi:hypothetical protein [Marinicella litoralis]|uniref:YcxB-like protein domain-containing protein n=1 Tax=Marinicella litoralis TaxID=644220 RepID=A0A4R6XYX6_9GAMM|nr:hypothetical protein [Marinicella litoralis]TDR23740.1 hypothetical protein C8D91_0605 [Marinicella litoralis]